jgi:hypothetical protein
MRATHSFTQNESLEGYSQCYQRVRGKELTESHKAGWLGEAEHPKTTRTESVPHANG